MAAKSKIEALPEELKERVRSMLERGSTIDAVVDRLNAGLREVGLEVAVSRSAVGRYKRRIDKLLETKRNQEEFLRAFAERTGGDDLSSERLQVARSLCFDTLLKVSDGGATAKDMQNLAAALLALERSTEIARRRLDDFRRAAAEAAKEELGKARAPKATVEAVVARLYGINA